MTDAPETQEAAERWRQGKINVFDEMARMERERNNWKAESLEQAKLLAMSADREEKLRAALQRIADCDWVITLPDRMDAVRKIAREALQ